MLKLAPFSVLAFIILNLQGSLANSQDKGHSVRLPQDAPIHCEDFCLAKLHPMMDLISETNSKLDTIHGEQQSIQMKLLAVQSTVEAQRITMQNSLKDITTKEEFGARMNETEEKLMTVNADWKNQLQSNLEDQQKPLLESLQRTITKDDLEVRLNATEDQLLVSSSELKTQLKEMQTKMDAQLLEVKKKLEDQNTVIFESLGARLNKTEEQRRIFETKMEAQLKELQNKTENQLLALENQQSAFQKTLLETQSDIYHKITHPKFERIGSRYFYIEHYIGKTWDEAAETCRGMGGYLAAFETKEELAAIMGKLKKGYFYYWTGINDSKEDGKFISTASGKPATVFKWREGYPNNSGACVMLDNRGMIDYYCSSKNYFICQSDNET